MQVNDGLARRAKERRLMAKAKLGINDRGDGQPVPNGGPVELTSEAKAELFAKIVKREDVLQVNLLYRLLQMQKKSPCNL